MADRDAIQARAEALILDTDALPSGAVVDWIQKAQREAEERYGFLAMEAEQPYTADGGTNGIVLSAAKPSDWLRRRLDPYWISGTGKKVGIDWIGSDDELHSLYNPDDAEQVGAPKHIEETASGFNVYPTPDDAAPTGSFYSDGLYRVRIPYWKRLATLSAGSDTNWFTDNAQAYLEWYAASEGMFFNRDREAGIEARTMAEAELARAIRFDKRLRLPRQVTMPVYLGPRARSA